MMMRMKLPVNRAELLKNLQNRLESLPETLEGALPEQRGGAHGVLVAAAWVLGGLGVVTLGLLAGRELRGRYKFKRRTPYDYYAHSGDRSNGLDYSVGI